MAAYYVKTLSDNLGYVTWIYYPAMGTLNCNPMFNNVLSIISVYGIRDCCNQIKYDYGRLVGISYLDHSENDMMYHYGATYDSWNRVRTMTYPDGEVVTYHYNAAGQVESLTSNKLGKNETLIEKIGYDKDGHTVYTKLGNGTESRYTYDKQRERLQEMTLSSAGNTVMQNKYKYDLVDNILGITNAVDPTQANSNNNNSNNNSNNNKAKLGGAFNHTYAYDDLNHLIKASGKAKGASYEMTMTFGRMSEPLTKVQKVDSTKTAQSYDFTYKYEDSNHPTAPTQIGHEHYTYDANGNPTLVENDSLNTERRMYWDEDNRLMVLSDNGKTSRYTYNAGGERIIKSHGDLEGVYINGAPQGMTFHETEDYTIYPAPIITVTKNRFTKHYFVGDKRIASKLGTGKFSNVYGISSNNVTAGQKDYAARMLQIEKQREEYYRKLGTPPGVPTMKGATADPDNTGYGYNTIIGELGDHSVPEGWVQRPKFNEKGDVPGPPIQWQKPEDPDNAQPGYGYIPTDTTNIEDIFFYHSDYLGSTSYITDAKANITLFDAYLPYGELLVDEHSSSEEMPYKFNGKELDQEMGLYYYGARYMNPVTSIWYGVDPMAEKYPNIGAYIYCHGNPIKLVDPDGRDDFFNLGGVLVKNSGQTNNIYVMVSGKPILITKLDLGNKANRQTVANIIGHYAAQIGVSYYAKGGNPIGNNPEGTVGLSVSNNPKVLALNKGNSIFVNKYKNTISNFLSNVYNLKNILVHENTHKKGKHGFKSITNFEHAEVYSAQLEHASFSKTTSDFKEEVLNSMTSYLKDAIIEDGTNDKRVYRLIEKANNAIRETGFSLSFSRYSSDTAGFNITVNKKKI